jgi:outer membrane protein OmpA-like peptidoglycan-associated protein
MKKTFLLLILFFITAAIIIGCACNKPSMLQSGFKPQAVDAGEYQPKIDNFMVIFDASASMSYCYRDSNRFNTAKAIVGNMNHSLPEMSIKGALRSFGHSPSVSAEKTALMYGVTAYSRSGFKGGLDKIAAPGGNSPMEEALAAAGDGLASARGKIVLILVSDGEGMGEETVASAQKLKDRFGERLCFYTICVGDNPAGQALLSKIAQAGGCGYAKTDAELNSSSKMIGFVKDVFLEKRMDADGDGVYDDQDACPNTPTGTSVDGRGCPLDTDGDGVADYLDQCPNTPADVSVDAKGCPLDADGDGVADYLDQCPNTPANVNVNIEGCPLDADGDGVADNLDRCPNTPEYTQVDSAGCPLDADQDGVADYLDKCPYTRKGAKVDANGCPVDSDGDGIVDYMDNCPDTPGGTQVDYSGCPLPVATKSAKVTDAGTWLYEDIKFDSGSAKIKSASYPVLDEIAALLKGNPGLKVEVQGHTDSAGSREMNLKLSKNRAKSVVTYLLQKGVSQDQLSSEGYGPSRPMASNDSAAGRAKNRRVELKPIK